MGLAKKWTLKEEEEVEKGRFDVCRLRNVETSSRKKEEEEGF